jgi:drug/metabolite transporter (DMT)-like permease
MSDVPTVAPSGAASTAIRQTLMDQRGMAIPAADRAMAGIGLGVLAYVFFSAHDATIKFLVTDLPVWQILFVRSLMITVTCLAIGRGRLVEQAMRTPLKMALLLRGVLTLVAWLCYYTAARSLPLAQLITLAAPVLGEIVTRGRWIAVSVGFVGVMVASDPLGVRLSWPTVLVLFAACLWGYGVLLMRQIARRESSLLQMLASNLVFVVFTGAISLSDWHHTTPLQFWLLMAVGVLGGMGQFALFEGARRAPAAVMATVEYTGLLWAFILGYAIFGDIPRLPVFIGAGLIVCAGVLLIGSERRTARRAMATARLR